MSHRIGFGFVPESNNNGDEVNAEEYPIRAAKREAELRERVMMNIIERQRNRNNDNNNNNSNNSNNSNSNNSNNSNSNNSNNSNNYKNSEMPSSEMNNMSGINAERFPNNVSEREAELRMSVLTAAERRNYYKPGMEGYMFNRTGADERFSQNVMNSIHKLLPAHEAIKAKERAISEKYIDPKTRNAERRRLVREREGDYLKSLQYLHERGRAHAAEQVRLADKDRLDRLARLAHLASEHESARLFEENTRRQAMQEFLRAEALHPARGLRRQNATVNGVPGRRNYLPPPGRRKSQRLRKNNNKTHRR
jgi:hypothetical protein